MPERPFNHSGFTAYLSERRLMGSRCRQCGQTFLPPRAMCSNCYSTDMEWVEFSGEGELAGYTIVFVGLPVMTTQGFGRDKPYVSGIVQLAEGPAISGQIMVDGLSPEEIRVGMPLRVTYIERGKLSSGDEGTTAEAARLYLAFEKK